MPPDLEFDGAKEIKNASDPYSLKLRYDKLLMTRLYIILLVNTLGSYLNVLYIRIFYMKRELCKYGYMFYVDLGLSDLLITITLMVSCNIIMLSDENLNVLYICQTVQFFGLTSTYCYHLFFMFLAIENYLHCCCQSDAHDTFISIGAKCISITVFFISFLVGAIGILFDLDYNHCQNNHYGNTFYKRTVFIFFHGIPFVITTLCLVLTAFQKETNTRVICKLSSCIVNITVYFVYVFSWVPYLIIAYKYPKEGYELYYYFIWAGLIRSIFANTLFCVFNSTLRHALCNSFSFSCYETNETHNQRHRVVMRNRSANVEIQTISLDMIPEEPDQEAIHQRDEEMNF